jgi:DNA primase
MIDTTHLKQTINCRDTIERIIGAPKYHSVNWSSWKCPFHHEVHGYSFAATDTSWRCFGQCNTGGDIITFIEKWYGYDFQAACQHLGHGHFPSVQLPPRQHTPKPDDPPAMDWQEKARAIVENAMKTLWSEQGNRALAYLMETRGLSEAILITNRIGYIPGRPDEWKSMNGLTVPCGIVIPYFEADELWAVRVRRAKDVIGKYHSIKGSRPTLYLGATIRSGHPLIIDEGEFNALTLLHLSNVSSAALGSASNQIKARWFHYLAASPIILARMDEDEAGQQALARLKTLSQGIRAIQVPNGFKDINEWWVSHRDTRRLQDWIDMEIEKATPRQITLATPPHLNVTTLPTHYDQLAMIGMKTRRTMYDY